MDGPPFDALGCDVMMGPQSMRNEPVFRAATATCWGLLLVAAASLCIGVATAAYWLSYGAHEPIEIAVYFPDEPGLADAVEAVILGPGAKHGGHYTLTGVPSDPEIWRQGGAFLDYVLLLHEGRHAVACLPEATSPPLRLHLVMSDYSCEAIAQAHAVARRFAGQDIRWVRRGRISPSVADAPSIVLLERARAEVSAHIARYEYDRTFAAKSASGMTVIVAYALLLLVVTVTPLKTMLAAGILRFATAIAHRQRAKAPS